MQHFIFFYRGGSHPEDPHEQKAHMAKWERWIADLGEAVINPGTPLGPTKIVRADEILDAVSSDAISGFTTIEAEHLDAAIAIAKTCPFIDIVNGTLEVAQVRSFTS